MGRGEQPRIALVFGIAALVEVEALAQPSSTGGAARNSGPPKSPPIPAWPVASWPASSAISCVSALALRPLEARKSTVPAMRVFRWSVGKRVIGRMPDLPAVRAAQFSSLPTPSDVTTPMPVTTTMGRPKLSVIERMTISLSVPPPGFRRPRRGPHPRSGANPRW
jgi:hypothetical protein